MIAPVWGAVAAAALLPRRQPCVGGAALVLTGLVASWYFADVFGYVPAGLALAVGLEHGLRCAFSRNVREPGSDGAS